MTKQVAIAGAGGFGLDALILLKRLIERGSEFNIIGFFDDNPNLSDYINGFPVIGDINALNQFNSPLNVVLAIGESTVRSQIRTRLNNNLFSFPTLVDPSVIVRHEMVKLGQGCIILAGTTISGRVTIQNHVVINQNCTIGHDSKLNDFVSVMPGVNISGDCELGNGVYVGTGAQLINQKSIGSWSKVGAGATVVNCLPANVIAVGVPAKVIRHNRN